MEKITVVGDEGQVGSAQMSVLFERKRAPVQYLALNSASRPLNLNQLREDLRLGDCVIKGVVSLAPRRLER